jgi:two-component system response regulator AtoC
MKANILIVDDQVDVYKSLARNFQHRGYHTTHAQTGQEALERVTQELVHVVLLDIMLGKEHGLEVLKQLLQRRKDLPVIMITGYGSIASAVQAIKLGAVDYITKPFDFENLFTLVEQSLNASNARPDPRQNQDAPGEISSPIITQSPKMLALCEQTQKLAATDLPILITGEDGTGKENFADFIHSHSPRSAQKMLKINCAAFPETLLDNELFGHEKGAYTGADTAFKGVFERADQSALFFDEIGDMPLTIQAKILRALQNREIRRIGGNQTILINVRFIAATNKDLPQLVEEKLFRKDLFYRLNTAMVQIPPLRHRKEDILPLINHFLTEYAQTHAAPVKSVSDEVLDKLLDYDWPGNVRELKNIINYAAAITSKDTLDLEDLPPIFTHCEQQTELENIRDETERTLILKVLHKAQYNKTMAAELLNMSRSTLYSKLEKYGIAIPK